MKYKKINPSSSFKGEIHIPSSKSYSQRALALSLIAKGKTRLYNLGTSDDELAALDVIKRAGAKVSVFTKYIEIEGVEFHSDEEIQVSIHESGLSARMFLPLLGNFNSKVTITGSGSILNRPMDFFEETLPKIGVEIITNAGKLPISIVGPIQARDMVVDGSLSSQFITGLIYAYLASPNTANQCITVSNMTSKPYIDLSIDLARQFGADLVFKENEIHFQGPYSLRAPEISIEGDWSSAAFFVVAAAMYGSVELYNLSRQSAQGDKVILEIVEQFGAKVEYSDLGIHISKQEFNFFHTDATDYPDLFPILAVLASKGKEVSTIKGVSRLYHKESNRALAIQSELFKMGVRIEINEQEDRMYIYPCSKIISCDVDGHNDHRIVMACAVLALGGDGETAISTPLAINKSFPTFFKLLETCIQL
jgi:3-phosphoshikimate 1-carboxyvinyltransferase